MRKSGLDKTALLVVLATVGLVVSTAAGLAPAYSDDASSEPATASQPAQVDAELEATAEAGMAQPEAAEPRGAAASDADTEGYQWSGSRPAGERYLWSHRAN